MAFFSSELAFDITTLDLHAVYAQPRNFGFIVADPVTFTPPALAFGGGTLTIPSVTITPGTILGVTAGQQTLLIGGNNVAVNPFGEAIGGQVTLIGQTLDGQVQFLLAGLNTSANAVSLATGSVATEDDALLFYGLLVRNDFIALSAGNDRFDAGEGKDLVVDQGGADKISGGYGDDFVLSGKGNDTVDAGSGSDLVLGGAGDDRIVAGLGNDVIWAGMGNDISAGGGGQDVFIFKPGDGKDHIMGFAAANDQILFAGPVSGLANLHMRQMGADLKITFADVTVILDQTLRSSVTLADFDIGGNGALEGAAHRFFDGWDYS